jgi:hypothetical protein
MLYDRSQQANTRAVGQDDIALKACEGLMSRGRKLCVD